MTSPIINYIERPPEGSYEIPVPKCITDKPRHKLTLTDCVFMCIRKRYSTFWEIQQRILDNTGTMYGEPSISAAIRALRHYENRVTYGLEKDVSIEVVGRRRRSGSKGYEYKLI